MTKAQYVKGDDGKMKGSIGVGKDKVPTPSLAPKVAPPAVDAVEAVKVAITLGAKVDAFDGTTFVELLLENSFVYEDDDREESQGFYANEAEGRRALADWIMSRFVRGGDTQLSPWDIDNGYGREHDESWDEDARKFAESRTVDEIIDYYFKPGGHRTYRAYRFQSHTMGKREWDTSAWKYKKK